MTRRVRRRVGDDRGQILLLTAVSLTALIGMAALTLDASMMYDKRNMLFSAADAAAKSGAIEVFRKGGCPSIPQADLERFADQQVQAHGFQPVRLGGDVTVTVNCPPSQGPFVGNNNYVEVFTSQPNATYIGALFSRFSMTPGARAVAGTSPDSPCIITLAPPTPLPPAPPTQESFEIGAATLTMPGCTVEVGGDLVIAPAGGIDADGTSLVGDCSGNGGGGGCDNVNNMSDDGLPPHDPLEDLPFPAEPPGCTTPPAFGGNGTYSLSPGCYNSLDLSATNITLNLDPGLYYFKGPVVIGNYFHMTGTGVMIALAGTGSPGDCESTSTAGCFTVNQNTTMTLSAQTTGPYTGILFYQEATNHIDADFNGNSPTYDFSGAMYFPGAHVDFRNGLDATNDCTLIVAYTLEIENGNGQLDNTCSAYGGSPFMTVALAE